MRGRNIAVAAFLLSCLVGAMPRAQAQNWPDRTVKIVVPFAPVILETQVDPSEAMYQLQIARAFFSNAADFVLDSSYQMTHGLSTSRGVILGNQDVVPAHLRFLPDLTASQLVAQPLGGMNGHPAWNAGVGCL